MLSYQVEEFGKPLAQALRDTPAPQGTEVLVKIGSSGVCHSDVHLQDGYFDLGGGNKLDMGRAMQPPRTMGHEIAGTVVALGPDAQGASVGDRRVVYPWVGCGTCSLCEAGEEQVCTAPRALGIHRDGGFASHVLVPHARYLFAYDPLPEEQACVYACSGLTAYGALKKAGNLGARDALVIIGAGGVGLSGIRLARQLFPATPLTVVEIDKSKWDVARTAGATELVDPNAEGALKDLLKATGGGAAAVIDFVGAAATFNFGLGAVRKAGKLIVVGLFGGSTNFVPAMMVLRAQSITASYVGNPREMGELMTLARAGTLAEMPMSTRPLAEASAALEDLRAGRIKGRVVLKP